MRTLLENGSIFQGGSPIREVSPASRGFVESDPTRIELADRFEIVELRLIDGLRQDQLDLAVLHDVVPLWCSEPVVQRNRHDSGFRCGEIDQSHFYGVLGQDANSVAALKVSAQRHR